MKKKEYLSPAIDIVELKHIGMLMTSGQVDATMNDTFTEEDLAPEFNFEDEFNFWDEEF